MTATYDHGKLRDRSELIALASNLGVRSDWHEPDEQDLTARVFGTSFDNAGFWGEGAERARYQDHEEMHVVLYQDDYPVASVNLATLFAWATGHHN